MSSLFYYSSLYIKIYILPALRTLGIDYNSVVFTLSDLAQSVQMAERPLVVVLGTTASGKTAFSIQLAKHIRGAEIINSDSRQFYKYLNIGTAKITTAEMQGIPHHLLDVLDPKDAVSTGWYKREAESIIVNLHRSNKVPMLVGGSMLYISAITDNYTLPVPVNTTLRNQLQERLTAEGLDTLYNELLTIDPIAAQSIHKHNTQHILRALEFFYQTGMPKSVVLAQAKSPSNYTLFIVGIQRERPEIIERIIKRTTHLFATGWLEEVQSLLSMGYTSNDPGMMSHGYRECIDFCTHGGDLAVLQQSIIKQTCDYAKRQMTWWKRDDRIQWYSAADLHESGFVL